MAALRRSLVIPCIVAALLLAGLIALGVWQVERLAWKQALIATLEQRLTAPPAALPEPAQWPRLDKNEYEYRRVRFRAEYVAGQPGARGNDGRVWTVGSTLRDDVKSPGLFVFSPARLPGGEVVVVNRGFVAEDKPTLRTRVPPVVAGPVEITGILRWPELAGWFMITGYDATQDIWFIRDHAAIAAEHRWGRVAPFYVEREVQTPPDTLPPPRGFKPNLPNNHLGYAITWFGLAAVLVVAFAIWFTGQRRRRADGRSASSDG